MRRKPLDLDCAQKTVRSALHALPSLPELPGGQTGSAFVINLLIEADRVELLAGVPQEAILAPAHSDA
jgi:hypothetical protein